jgi:hypothetical protein
LSSDVSKRSVRRDKEEVLLTASANRVRQKTTRMMRVVPPSSESRGRRGRARASLDVKNQVMARPATDLARRPGREASQIALQRHRPRRQVKRTRRARVWEV